MIYQLSEFDPSEFFNSFTDSKHIVIAFSGGIDSSVMLNIMCKKRDKLKQSIEAIYIDHGPVSYTHLTLPTILLV